MTGTGVSPATRALTWRNGESTAARRLPARIATSAAEGVVVGVDRVVCAQKKETLFEVS